MQIKHWGMAENHEVFVYALANSRGMEVRVATYGATLTHFLVPNARGERSNIVLGYDHIEDYRLGRAYLGATIGRYANRISRGHFVLNGKSYQLSRNNKGNMLHGGFCGFDKKIWSPRVTKDSATAQSVEFSYTSPDGDEGFPGNLDVRVTYTLTDLNELTIDYRAESDQDTVVNLTNHSYFNLSGSPDRTVLDHELFLNASHYLPVNTDQIPTGEIASVANTPFDFRVSKLVGQDIKVPNEQIEYGNGYDLNWVLIRNTDELSLAAKLTDKNSGRMMEVFTTEPAVQFYSGNLLEDASSANARVYPAHAGLCLETQHFPDSPNHPRFPTTVLQSGSTYRSRTVLRLSW